MLIFVLSAIHPDKMHLVLKNIYKVKLADFAAFKALLFSLKVLFFFFPEKITPLAIMIFNTKFQGCI